MVGNGEAEAHSLGGVLEAREIPRIGGSSAAFVVLIVLLLLVIVVAGGGIIYLLREDSHTSTQDRWRTPRRIGRAKGPVAHGDVDDEDYEALGQRARGAYQRQGSSDSAPHDGGWAASVKRLFWRARGKSIPRHESGGMLPSSSSDSPFSPQAAMRGYSANPVPPGRQHGWMQAASESDWDLRHHAAPQGAGSADNNNLRMVERRLTDSPLMSGSGSPRSSYFAGGGGSGPSYSHPYSASRMTTAESITSSAVRFDDSVNLPVRHGSTGGGPVAAPSILSGRYFASPTTSPTGSSTALPLASPTSLSRSTSPVHLHHTTTMSSSSHSHSAHTTTTRPIQQKLPSRMTMTSASEVSLGRSESYPSHEYVLANHSPFPAPSPSIRTFGSGSRFVEGL